MLPKRRTPLNVVHGSTRFAKLNKERDNPRDDGNPDTCSDKDMTTPDSATVCSDQATPGTLRLGDLSVGRLGFGAMRITGRGVWGPPADRAAAVRLLRRAVELGVTFIDTADSYGPAVSEELIAEALAHGCRSGSASHSSSRTGRMPAARSPSTRSCARPRT